MQHTGQVFSREKTLIKPKSNFLIDDIATTSDSVAGKFPELLSQAGAKEVHEYQNFNTMLGTLRRLNATQ